MFKHTKVYLDKEKHVEIPACYRHIFDKFIGADRPKICSVLKELGINHDDAYYIAFSLSKSAYNKLRRYGLIPRPLIITFKENGIQL